MGYLSDLIKSFEPGGQTPIAALFGLDDSSKESLLSDINEYSDHSWVNYDLSDAFTSSDVLSDDDQSLIDDYYAKAEEAAEQQQAAAQSSADRAMEFSAEQAEINRQFNSEQAQINRDFQERMSNTAYQRAMEDLRAAGLNPKLVGQIGGASTPSGYSASGSAASGSSASMSAANVGSITSVLSSYITGSDALDRQSRDFVQNFLYAVLSLAVK